MKQQFVKEFLRELLEKRLTELHFWERVPDGAAGREHQIQFHRRQVHEVHQLLAA